MRRLWPDGRELALPGRGRDVDTVGWVPWAGPLTRALTANANVAHPDTTYLAPGPVPFGLRAGTAGGQG